MAGLLDDPTGYLSGLLGAGWNRFRGVDPATGEADYWKRGGLAGLLGMPSWDEQPKTDIAMGFTGSTTPAVKGILGAVSGAGKNMIDDLASRVAGGAEGLGYKVGREGSNLSSSQYLTLSHPALEDAVRIRIADHSLPPTYARQHGPADIELGPHGEATGWENALANLARRVGADVPRDAAEEIARAAAEREALAAVDASRAAAYAERSARKEAAFAAAPESSEAARIADLRARLADPQVTGNQRKKLNGKLRDALSRVNVQSPD